MVVLHGGSTFGMGLQKLKASFSASSNVVSKWCEVIVPFTYASINDSVFFIGQFEASRPYRWSALTDSFQALPGTDVFKNYSQIRERRVYSTNDRSIFCFGFQCRGAWEFSVDVKNQIELLHRIEDWIELLNILDSILRISSYLA